MKRGWLGQTLLGVLIGVNLTLVCQGHDHEGTHSGPHLAVFGEPDTDGGSDPRPAAPDPPAAGPGRVAPSIARVPPARFTPASPAGTNTAQLAATTPLETAALAGLEVLLAPWSEAAGAGRLANVATTGEARGPQTTLQPDQPPPRQPLPALAWRFLTFMS